MTTEYLSTTYDIIYNLTHPPPGLDVTSPILKLLLSSAGDPSAWWAWPGISSARAKHTLRMSNLVPSAPLILQ
jgi:hypothetical protein